MRYFSPVWMLATFITLWTVAFGQEPMELGARIAELRAVWMNVEKNELDTLERQELIQEFLAKSLVILATIPPGHEKSNEIWLLRANAQFEIRERKLSLEEGQKSSEFGQNSNLPEPTHSAPSIPKQQSPLPSTPPESIIITVDALKLMLVPIKPGDFLMGSPETDELRYDDEKEHRARISKSYWLGRTEVTQSQYALLMGESISGFSGANRPVENVSWSDAVSWCQKLTEMERAAGRLPDGYIYRLPTETEWEYACRAGSREPHSGKLEDLAWYEDNSDHQTHEVGSKLANAWGLYDMHGNVYEWCFDWFADYPQVSTDSTGPSSGEERVQRGGCWNTSANFCRSAFRTKQKPIDQFYYTGFRVALAPNFAKTTSDGPK